MVGRRVSATRPVAATPDKIFELLTDPTEHPLLDGSGTVRRAQQSGPQRPELGSTFGRT